MIKKKKKFFYGVASSLVPGQLTGTKCACTQYRRSGIGRETGTNRGFPTGTNERFSSSGINAAANGGGLNEPTCNEHGTFYAISSDFGDRMTTQSMGLI